MSGFIVEWDGPPPPSRTGLGEGLLAWRHGEADPRPYDPTVLSYEGRTSWANMTAYRLEHFVRDRALKLAPSGAPPEGNATNLTLVKVNPVVFTVAFFPEDGLYSDYESRKREYNRSRVLGVDVSLAYTPDYATLEIRCPTLAACRSITNEIRVGFLEEQLRVQRAYQIQEAVRLALMENRTRLSLVMDLHASNALLKNLSDLREDLALRDYHLSNDTDVWRSLSNMPPLVRQAFKDYAAANDEVLERSLAPTLILLDATQQVVVRAGEAGMIQQSAEKTDQELRLLREGIVASVLLGVLGLLAPSVPPAWRWLRRRLERWRPQEGGKAVSVRVQEAASPPEQAAPDPSSPQGPEERPHRDPAGPRRG